VQWKPEIGKSDVTADRLFDETHIYWNLNGFRSRFTTGELVNLINRYRPTTLALGEIKTSLLDVEGPQDLQYILRGLGYPYCIWNWCTRPAVDGSKGSGNFGIAVFSRTPLTDVRYGVGHSTLDKEGRTITAIVNGRPFIWIYAPSSRLNETDPRNALKLEYIEALATHTVDVRRDSNANPYLFGDLNVARRSADCSLHIDEG
jgi:exonuclease III